MLVLSKCWLLCGPDRACVFLQAFWGCKSESSPMVPWPLTLRGRSHQMWSVCWDSGEGQLGLTRGGPVSPNCHREHGQRGSVSTVINHTPSLSLSLSFHSTFPFSHSLVHTVFLFALSLTLLHSLSFLILLSAFVFLSLFPFCSLRYPLFHLDYQLFHSQPHTVHAFSFTPPSHIHTLTFLVWLFFFRSLSNLFHLCLSSILAHTFIQKNSFTCPLTTQMLWKDTIFQKDYIDRDLSYPGNLIKVKRKCRSGQKSK